MAQIPTRGRALVPAPITTHMPTRTRTGPGAASSDQIARGPFDVPIDVDAQFPRSISRRRVAPLPSADPRNPLWRRRLRMASFKNATFYVEQQGRTSGRRVVVFEYPKRDIPFTEDMGRQAIRYQMTGYLIQAPRNPGGTGETDVQYGAMWRDYDINRDILEAALMSPGPGRLIDPYNPRLAWDGYNGQEVLFFCERYTIMEDRQKGGFCTVEMSYVEAGIPGNSNPDISTAAAVTQIGQNVLNIAARKMTESLQKANEPKPPASAPAPPADTTPLPPPGGIPL